MTFFRAVRLFVSFSLFAAVLLYGALATFVANNLPVETMTTSEFASKADKSGGWVALTDAKLSTRGCSVNQSWVDDAKTTKEVSSFVLPALGPDSDNQVHVVLAVADGPMFEQLCAFDRYLQERDMASARIAASNIPALRVQGYVYPGNLGPDKIDNLTAAGLTLASDYVVIEQTTFEPDNAGVATFLYVLAFFPALWLFLEILAYRRFRARVAKAQRARLQQRSPVSVRG